LALELVVGDRGTEIVEVGGRERPADESYTAKHSVGGVERDDVAETVAHRRRTAGCGASPSSYPIRTESRRP
jgi:hypothetical protein